MTRFKDLIAGPNGVGFIDPNSAVLFKLILSADSDQLADDARRKFAEMHDDGKPYREGRRGGIETDQGDEDDVDEKFEELLSILAALAADFSSKGEQGRRQFRQDLFPNLEMGMQGFSEAVDRIWEGERDFEALCSLRGGGRLRGRGAHMISRILAHCNGTAGL